MQNRKDYEEFREIIRDIVSDLVEEILKEENLYVSHTGVIIDITESKDNKNPFLQKCTVDLIYTTVKGVLNKSGELLSIGNTVKLLEKKGSNLSDCLIAWKNGE